MNDITEQPATPEIGQERLQHTFVFRMRLADGFISIGKILSLGVPGYFVWKVFETFGGKTTTFSVDIITKVSVVVSVGSVAAVIAAWAKMKSQKAELIRCRQRVDELEAMIAETQDMEKER